MKTTEFFIRLSGISYVITANFREIDFDINFHNIIQRKTAPPPLFF